MTEEIDKDEISTLAIVDTACAKTMSEEEWNMNYIKDLRYELKNQINSFESNKLTLEMDTMCFVTKRLQILLDYCFIDIELVKERIPLLLSKSSLKKNKKQLLTRQITKPLYLIKR